YQAEDGERYECVVRQQRGQEDTRVIHELIDNGEWEAAGGMPTLESIQTADPLRRVSVRIGRDRCRVAVVTHSLSLPTIAAGRTRRRRGTTDRRDMAFDKAP